VPRQQVLAGPRESAPAPGGHRPLRADDGRGGEPRHPGALCPLPHRRRLCRRGAGGDGALRGHARLLSQQGALGDRPWPRAGGAARRRGAGEHGGARAAPRRRPQDGERAPRRRLRDRGGRGGGHARQAHRLPLGPHARGGPGEDRAGPDAARTAGGARAVHAPDHRPRPRRVHRPPPLLRVLRPRRAVPHRPRRVSHPRRRVL
ncbi:MAG: Endonuclease III, partial [uncultured Gemmatimonadetes bacterium]